MRSTTPVRTSDIVQEEIKLLYDTYGSWRRVQAEKHPEIPRGTLCTIAKDGYIPKKWYHHFGIQEYKPAPACMKCGQVHVTRRCTVIKPMPSRWIDWNVDDLRKAIEGRR